MAIKFSIKALEEVDEALRPQYKAVDANDPTKGFVLDVDGLPQPEDVGALKRSLENAKNERNAAIEKARRAGEDVEAVRKSLDTQMEGLRKQIADANILVVNHTLFFTLLNSQTEFNESGEGFL